MLIYENERTFFPIKTLKTFLSVIEVHIQNHKNDEPNLAYLSILFGYLEHKLTVNQNVSDDKLDLELSTVIDNEEDSDFPLLHLEIVEKLYEHFVLILKAQVDKSLSDFTTRSGNATKHLCKHVSDVLWNGLLRSYHKDKAHIQSIFSYLKSKQLDCFGLAFALVASCQILNYADVHLVLSGDHAWVCYGDESESMVEVTWHGKGTEDRRGFDINRSITDKNWIYHDGNAVKCNRWMELASLVVSINPSIDSNLASQELLFIQWKVLDMLYRRSYIDRYPMALGTYCDLCEVLNSDQVPISLIESIHDEALHASRTHYDDAHVFPYISKAHFYLRQGQCKKAIACYANAAQVLSRYNYSKDDEEIYKDMIDIANEHLPQALRDDEELWTDTESYFQLVRFYDGICLWEEESPTPVLHSWWVRYFSGSLNRFTPEVREHFKDDTIDDQSQTGDRLTRKRFSNDPPKNSTDLLASDADQDGDALEKSPVSKLCLRSHKLIALRDCLTSGKKINTQSVSLLLTAQSEVHVVKRKSNLSEYSLEYSPLRRRKRTREVDT